MRTVTYRARILNLLRQSPDPVPLEQLNAVLGPNKDVYVWRALCSGLGDRQFAEGPTRHYTVNWDFFNLPLVQADQSRPAPQTRSPPHGVPQTHTMLDAVPAASPSSVPGRVAGPSTESGRWPRHPRV